MIRAKRFVNYNKLTLFASHLAHEYKRLGYMGFVNKYKYAKYYGMYKKYFRGYLQYLTNKQNNVVISDKDVEILLNKYDKIDKIDKKLIVEYDIYIYYFRCKEKDMSEYLNESVYEFLVEGFLVTKVQEAVHAPNNDTLFKKEKYK